MPGGYITRDYVTAGEIDGFRDFRTMTRKGLPPVIVECNFLGVGKPSRVICLLQPFWGGYTSSITAWEIVAAKSERVPGLKLADYNLPSRG